MLLRALTGDESMGGRADAADAPQFEHLKPYLAGTDPQPLYGEVAEALRHPRESVSHRREQARVLYWLVDRPRHLPPLEGGADMAGTMPLPAVSSAAALAKIRRSSVNLDTTTVSKGSSRSSNPGGEVS